ncbi:MAG TPA: bifunctional DNA-formamidopyrimidine glycosylase/DNA-(apurinic or apyrimidinic site) lyase [Gaiellaceae bacterium]|nr:bifunctional DNA-formamidopyrimidine glycosylase/DNA-(apurinic or apyrimidinic site) lyase [Gaiellaceae bacterium]
MPELPEVETVRRRLEPVLVGRTFADVEILDARLTRPHDPAEVAAELRGERVAHADRRGKYLVVRFESGRALLVHLRMTGTFLAGDAGTLEDPHRRAVARLDDGSDVAYRDVRRFGTWLLLEPDEVEPYLAVRLGPEPLTEAFTPEFLRERLRGRRAPLKAAVLDQRTVAGLGNIYADEALWRARLHPRREAGALRRPQLVALHAAIRDALELGIARQGSTLRDYRTPDGEAGAMQHEFKVYGRLGEPCDRCGTPIERIVVGGRGTWFCPRCQRGR